MLPLLLFIAFIVAFELLAYFWLPMPREVRPPDEVPIGQLERKFAIWEKWSPLPLVVFAIGLMVGWFFLFWLIRDWIHSQIPPSEILLTPSVAMFLVPAFFLGGCTAPYPTLMLWRLLLGSDYAEYTRFTTERTEVSPVLFFRRLMLLIVPIAVGFGLLTCDWYTRMTPKEFAENSLITLGESVYPLSDIVELRHIAAFIAPNGNKVDRPYFEIEFRDGFRWANAQDLYQLPPSAYARLMKRLMEETGKPLVKYQLPP